MKHWYIVQAYSNFENKVAEAIRENAETAGISEMFEQIVVPKETVTEVRRGRKIKTERKFFPGYVLVKMENSVAAFHLVRNTSRVAGFVGGGKSPMPMKDEEAENILSQLKDGYAVESQAIKFSVGEEVLVSDGPFASFTGMVEEVDAENSRVKVSVSIFGRSTPVDLEFDQITKT